MNDETRDQAPAPDEAPAEPSAAAGNTNSDKPSPDTERTDVERPASAIKVVCPDCGVGGEVASDELIGVAECGSSEHPGTKLVRA